MSRTLGMYVMANDPHNKTGKQCSVCAKVFTKSSATFSLAKREGNFVVHKIKGLPIWIIVMLIVLMGFFFDVEGHFELFKNIFKAITRAE